MWTGSHGSFGYKLNADTLATYLGRAIEDTKQTIEHHSVTLKRVNDDIRNADADSPLFEDALSHSYFLEKRIHDLKQHLAGLQSLSKKENLYETIL